MMKRTIMCPKGTQLQTLIFSKDYFTKASAKSWAEENDFKYGKVDEKENTFRLRQKDPELFEKDSFRTIDLRIGVQGVVACPIKAKKYEDGGETEFNNGCIEDIIIIINRIAPVKDWFIDKYNKNLVVIFERDLKLMEIVADIPEALERYQYCHDVIVPDFKPIVSGESKVGYIPLKTTNFSVNIFEDGGNIEAESDTNDIANPFYIKNILEKTQFSQGLKDMLAEDFISSGYAITQELIADAPDKLPLRQKIWLTSKNIQNNIRGFDSGKNTYLQANKIAEIIHNTKVDTEPHIKPKIQYTEEVLKSLGFELIKKLQSKGVIWGVPTLKQQQELEESGYNMSEIEFFSMEDGTVGVARKINLEEVAQEYLEFLYALEKEIDMDNSEAILYEDGAEVLSGGKADYMDLGDIADMHGVSLEEITKQAKIGFEIEREHTDDINKITEIVKDHLYESPEYYTKLKEMEKSLKSFPKEKKYSYGGITPADIKNEMDINTNNMTVSCFIYAKNTGRGLFVKRAEGDHIGTWSLVSGTVENEIPEDAMKREIKEELGFDCDNLYIKYVNYTKHSDKLHLYYEMYVDTEFTPMLNSENDSYCWVNMANLPENMHPLLKKYMKNNVFSI